MQWAKDNPEQFALNQRKYRLRKRHGIETDQYDKALVRQGGLCAICALKPDAGISLCVDQVERGTVRGLLCRRCNSGLEHFEGRIDLLLRVRNYLN